MFKIRIPGLVLSVCVGIILGDRMAGPSRVGMGVVNSTQIISHEVNKMKWPYDMGDLLNMPSFWSLWPRRGNPRLMDLGQKIARVYPSTIVGLYYTKSFDVPTVCQHRVPYRPRLIRAVQHFAAQHQGPHVDRDYVRRNDTLVMHLRLGDKGNLPPDYILHVCRVARRFKFLLILSALHNPGKNNVTRRYLRNTQEGVAEMVHRLKRCSKAEVVLHASQSADADLVLMQQAKHLMVSRGGYSMLAAWLCRGTVYMADCMGTQYLGGLQERTFFQDSEFRLQMARPRWVGRTMNSRHRDIFDKMVPLTPTCCDLKVLSRKYDMKLQTQLCANAPTLKNPQCSIVSVGAKNGRYFQARLLQAKTRCHVHRFDCHYTPPANASRVTFYTLCIGANSQGNGGSVTWLKLLQLISQTSSMDPAPALLHIEAEAFDFAFISSLLHRRAQKLPEQVLFEVRDRVGWNPGLPWGFRAQDQLWLLERPRLVAGLFEGLAHIGYRMVHRADNPKCWHCMRAVLVRNNTLLDFGDSVRRAFVT